MSTSTATQTSGAGVRLNHYGRRVLLAPVVMAGINLSTLLLTAGTWRWANAWVLIALMAACQATAILLIGRKNPTLLNERGKFAKKGTKGFDKIILSAYFFSGYAMLAVAGLDYRFEWSSVPLGISAIGLALMPPAFGFALWAMLENTHFEATVRLQTDRGHKVCTSGPYRFVRHPGYAGAILALSTLPPILGSYWAWIPAGLAVTTMIIRTALEDRMLHRELSGYTEFALKTRFRLVPGVW